MGKKANKGGAVGGRDFWDGLSGWKAVNVGDALLLGSDEYGFCGLEELDARAVGKALGAAAAAAAAAGGCWQGVAHPQEGRPECKACYDFCFHLTFYACAGDLMIPGGQPAEAAGDEAAQQQTKQQAKEKQKLKQEQQQKQEQQRKQKQEQQQKQKQEQQQKKRKQPDEAAAAAAAGSAGDAAVPQEQGQAAKAAAKKQKKKGKGVAAAAAEAEGAAPAARGSGDQGAEVQQEEGPESVAALKQQLATLAAENKKLKKQQKKEARLEKRAAAAAKREEERAARRAAAAEKAAAAAAASAEAARRVDISAWKDLQLHPSVEGAIAALGFEAPTHVQAECLPAAIRDRRDVIGAAQTGSGKTLAFGLPIMQVLLQEREARQAQQQAGAGTPATAAAAEAQAAGEAAGESEGGAAQPPEREQPPLRALILAPTRELALQVCEHLQVSEPDGW